jgi:hypothetical protein
VWRGQRCSRLSLARDITASPLGEMSSGPGDREALVVKEALDFEYGLDVFAPVEPMPARALHRLKHREFRFPEAQNKSLRGRQTAYFADPK